MAENDRITTRANLRPQPEPPLSEPEIASGAMPEADPSLLSDEDKEAIKVKARAQVQKELKDAARKKAMDAALVEARQEALIEPEDPNAEMVDVVIDLYPGADRIQLDNRIFFQARRYRVTKAVADTIAEICYQGWRHQRELEGKTTFDYRERGATISMKTGAMSGVAGLPGI